MSSSKSEDVRGVRKRNMKNVELEDEEDPEDEVFGGVDLFSDESHDEEGGEEAVEVKVQEGKSTKSKKRENDDKTKKKRVFRKNASLNYARLNGPTGLRLLKKSFSDFKFRGENHEKEDLTRIIQTMKHWMCYQLFPKYNFQDNIAQLEHLGSKKELQVLLKKMRLGMDDWGEQKIITPHADDLFDEMLKENPGPEPQENFNSWWNEQMALENNYSDKEERTKAAEKSQYNSQQNETNIQEPSQTHSQINLTAEQLERISKNKKLAEERRLQRLAKEKLLNDSAVQINDQSA